MIVHPLPIVALKHRLLSFARHDRHHSAIAYLPPKKLSPILEAMSQWGQAYLKETAD